MGAGRHADPFLDAAGCTATRRPRSRTRSCARRTRDADRDDREYELADTGVLADDRFFDVTISYAKAGPDDMCIVINATNHGPDAAPAAPAAADLVPQHLGVGPRRRGGRSCSGWIRRRCGAGHARAVECRHDFLGHGTCWSAEGAPDVLVCDNETDAVALFGAADERVRRIRRTASGAASSTATSRPSTRTAIGTKAAFWYRFDAVAAGRDGPASTAAVDHAPPASRRSADDFDAVVADRRGEADEFYAVVIPAETRRRGPATSPGARSPACCGASSSTATTSTQWLDGDPDEPTPPPEPRANAVRATHSWRHFALADVMSMPDEWEYPWFASWDLAFHCVPLAHIDPAFAKEQLLLLCREWAMHPNGQLPAYEWAFGDVNPPVHAWAAWRVYLIDGARDRDFLIRVFTKLLLNFGWWVNRKDADGSNLFEGGFLGMDNIGLFDRSAPLPAGYRLEESDATSWMAFFCLQMLKIASELVAATAGLGRDGDEVPRALPLDRAGRRADSAPQERRICGTTRTASSTTCWSGPTARSSSCRCGRWSGCCHCSLSLQSPTWAADELPDFTARLRWLRPAVRTCSTG